MAVKTKYWILLFALILAFSAALGIFFMRPGAAAAQAEIWSQGQLLRTVDLQTDTQFTVTTPAGGSNTVTVREGKIAVTEANCPDHYCMHRGFCHSGADIVCLPNKLVIVFVGEAEIDMIVG
jgi:hypothetical protein